MKGPRYGVYKEMGRERKRKGEKEKGPEGRRAGRGESESR